MLVLHRERGGEKISPMGDTCCRGDSCETKGAVSRVHASISDWGDCWGADGPGWSLVEASSLALFATGPKLKAADIVIHVSTRTFQRQRKVQRIPLMPIIHFYLNI